MPSELQKRHAGASNVDLNCSKAARLFERGCVLVSPPLADIAVGGEGTSGWPHPHAYGLLTVQIFSRLRPASPPVDAGLISVMADDLTLADDDH